MGRARRGAREETSAGGVVFRRLPNGGAQYLLIRDSYNNWGFPKGHLEAEEAPGDAALREIEEETGLENLVLRGPIGLIDWFFTFRGRLVHKYCHFFLVESSVGEPLPQADEGITACRWATLDQGLTLVSYANAREMLRLAGDLVEASVRAPVVE